MDVLLIFFVNNVMKTNLISSCAVLFLASSLNVLCARAQSRFEENVIVRSSLDKMFKNLDKSKVSTGLLLDYAMDLIDFEKYNGKFLADSNYVSIMDFQDMLSSVYSAHLEKSGIGNVAEIIDNFVRKSDNVKIGIVLYKYNYIRPNAIKDDLIVFDETSEMVSDKYIDGNWVDPYGEEIVFGCTPSTSLNTNTVIYKIDNNYYFSNVNNVKKFEFDPGDGQGYVLANIGDSITATYSKEGNVDIKFRVTLDNGDVYLSHSTVYIQSNNALELNGQYQKVEPTDSIIKSVVFNGVELKAQVTYYCVENSLKKPFIVVEGFDPRISSQLSDANIDNDGVVYLGNTTHRSFYAKYWSNSELADKYDLVYVDWNNSTEDIKCNAALLISILNDINLLKERAGSIEPNVLMGQSMGGLIARYALCKMESDGITHNVSTFISHDSPHLGANVPLGALYLVHDFLCLMKGYGGTVSINDMLLEGIPSVMEREMYNLINSTSVRQMLYNYVNKDGRIDNSYHRQWQKELQSVGFPRGDSGKQLENLAISNGGTYFINPTLYNGCLLYFDGYAKTRFLGDLLASVMSWNIGLFNIPSEIVHIASKAKWLGSNKLSCKISIKPYISSNYDENISQIEVKYNKKFLWFISKTYTLFSASHECPNGGLSYDELPGSLYYVPFEGERSSEPHEKSEYNKSVVHKYGYTLRMTNTISFVPTASSLCIGGGNAQEQDYLFDYYNAAPNLDKIPFDAYYIDFEAKPHIFIDNNIYKWIKEQIDFKISGPDRILSETVFSVQERSNITWSSSNKAIAVVDNNGKVTPTGNGVVRITAKVQDAGKLYRTHKDIIVSFPEIVLSSSYSFPTGYTVTAATVNPQDMNMVNQLVSEGELKYEWFLIDNDGNIASIGSDGLTLATKPKNTYTFIPNENEVTTVCMRIVDDEGNIGQTYSLTFNTESPFETIYKYVVVDENQRVYSIRNINQEFSFPTEPYSVVFKSLPSSLSVSMPSIINQMKLHGCYLEYQNNTPLNLTKYMKGIYNTEKDRWEFPVFDNNKFLSAMEDAYNNCSEERLVANFFFTLCTNTKAAIQKINFAIFCKPGYSLGTFEREDVVLPKPLPTP